MLLDLRIYTYHANKFRKFLKSYEEIGFALTSRHLGETLGVFRSDDGTMNQTLQFFLYKDANHREECRRAMLADPQWVEFVKIDGDAIVEQTANLWRPAPFSPLGGENTSRPALVAGDQPRLFELRTWGCQPGAFDEAMELLADGGATRMARHEPAVIGWFYAETGHAHRVLRLAAYTDWAQRDSVAAAAHADADTRQALKTFRALAAQETSQILLPLPSSPLR